MCNDLHSDAFARPLEEGRSLVSLTGALGAFSVASSVAAAVGLATPASAAVAAKKRSYVIVLDGLRPEEIGTSMPYVASLRAAGTHYPRATSQPVMETIPNHCMMMTGVRPDRTGVPAYRSTTGRPAWCARWTSHPTCARRR